MNSDVPSFCEAIMLSWSTASFRCSRRDWLTIGSAGLAGLTLSNLLRAEQRHGSTTGPKAVINIHLDGGPPQLDTIDLKPLAPREIRGEFTPIDTRLPGVQICELLPELAAIADRFAWIRSLTGSAGAHHAFQCQSGFTDKDLQSLGGRPAFGCVVSKLLGRTEDPTPAFVDLMQGRPLVRNSARPGFLGPASQPFRPDLSQLFPRELEPAMQGELKRLGGEHQISLTLHAELTPSRLTTRRQLLTDLDGMKRDIDGSGMMAAMDRFGEQAVSILTSGRLADALDPEREDPRAAARYDLRSSPGGEPSYTSDGPGATRKFLLARRLIEAGVRCVSLSLSDFDTHSNNFTRMRNLLPILDRGLSALVLDLEDRGMLDDVLIVAWGEFGRTPRIDANTLGRHHWPQVGPAILAGGGLRMGQVIGATDREAAAVTERPVHYKDIMATLYHHVGLDPHRTMLIDPQGRPQHLLDTGAALRELV
jgi:hypothetical protein